MLTAVTFDFWNTIAHVPEGTMAAARRRAVAAACEDCGAAVEAERLDRTLDEVRLHWERSWAAGTHLHPSEGARMLVGGLELDEDQVPVVSAAFLGALEEAPLEVAPGIGEALEALAGRGLRLGIVCDAGFSGGETLRGLLAREGLLERFDGWGFSDEVGHYKPAPQIFEAALEALDARPGEALHVGDLRRTDIAGAAALGMRTVRYRGLRDDPEDQTGIEAEFVLDTHAELPSLADRIGIRGGGPETA